MKQGKLHSPLVEVTPLVFRGKLYLLENWQKQWEHPGAPDGSDFKEDEVRIRDLASDTIVSTPLIGHGLGMALVWDDQVYVFAADWGHGDKKWGARTIDLTSSSDLSTWTKPVVVLQADPREQFFNVSVCRAADRFVLLVETNDPQWPPFTFKFFSSDNPRTWNPVPKGLYGTDKYVGGPALYYEGEWFYLLYLQSLGEDRFETRITRSKDLVAWQDAPADCPFLTFDPQQHVHPLRPSTIRESNASDAEVVYWKNRTLVYFTGGDQHLCGDLQTATYDGTPRELFESFFDKPDAK